MHAYLYTVKKKIDCYCFPSDALMNPTFPRKFLHRVQRQSNVFHFLIAALNLYNSFTFRISPITLFPMSGPKYLIDFFT